MKRFWIIFTMAVVVFLIGVLVAELTKPTSEVTDVITDQP